MRTVAINGIDRKYMDWRDLHPEYYGLFIKFSKALIDHGKRFSARLLIERVRWEVHIQKGSGENFKIVNAFTPYIARDLIEDLPELKDMIVTHRVSEDVIPHEERTEDWSVET